MVARTGMARGLNKGRATDVIEGASKRRPSRARRAGSKRVSFVREIVREVAGLAPYEKRIMDLIKLMGSESDKKVYKVAKKRLGTHRRALMKRAELNELASAMRAKRG